jgi:hypothetical protein
LGTDGVKETTIFVKNTVNIVVFLLSLISPEHSFVSHNTAHISAEWFCYLSKLMFARIVYPHPQSHGHHGLCLSQTCRILHCRLNKCFSKHP